MKEKTSDIKNKKRSRLLCIFLAVLLLAVILANRNFLINVLQKLRGLSPVVFLSACTLGLFYRVLDGFFLYVLGRKYSQKLTLSDGILSAFCGSFFRVSTLGSGMAASKIFYLHRNGVPVGNGMGICLLQSIYCNLAVLLLGLSSYALSQPAREALQSRRSLMAAGTLICVLIAVGCLVIALSSTVTDFLFRLAYRVAGKHEKWRSGLDRVREQVDLLQTEARSVLSDGRLSILLLLDYLLMETLWYLIPSIVAASEGISPFSSFAVTAVACMLAGAIPAPSGFGSVEVVFTLLFRQLGNSIQSALAMVIFRFATTFVPFFPGALAVFFSRKQSDQALGKVRHQTVSLRHRGQ